MYVRRNAKSAKKLSHSIHVKELALKSYHHQVLYLVHILCLHLLKNYCHAHFPLPADVHKNIVRKVDNLGSNG